MNKFLVALTASLTLLFVLLGIPKGVTGPVPYRYVTTEVIGSSSYYVDLEVNFFKPDNDTDGDPSNNPECEYINATSEGDSFGRSELTSYQYLSTEEGNRDEGWHKFTIRMFTLNVFDFKVDNVRFITRHRCNDEVVFKEMFRYELEE